MTLNPAGLAHFTSWVTTLPPRPLPRTVTPIAGEYHLGYLGRLADANHLKFGELAGALRDTAAITVCGPLRWKQHEQERLAVAASQPLDRITRLCWPDAATWLRDIEGFNRPLRPACRRCAARHGITGPVPCRLPPHQVLCRRHQLWTGPAARSHDQQLDVSPLPEIGRAHRRHLALIHRYPRHHVDTAVSEATSALYQAIRDGTRIAGQQRRLHHLAPGTWQQALATAITPRPWRPDEQPPHPAIEIALYPDVIWITERILRTRHQPASPEHDEMAHKQ